MNSSLNNLNAFVTHFLNPTKLISYNLASDFSQWQSLLLKEGDDLRLHLIQYLLGHDKDILKVNYLERVQKQLLYLSDEINSYLIKGQRLWSTHKQASEIRRQYLLTLDFFDQMQVFISSKFPDMYAKHLKLPDFQLKNVIPLLRQILNDLRNHLEEVGVSFELISMLIRGLKSLLKRGLSRSDLDYISQIYERFISVRELDDDRFEQMLLEMNFNLPEFYLYLADQFDERLYTINGLHEQLEYIYQRDVLWSKPTFVKEKCLNSKFPAVLEEIVKYSRERQLMVERLINLRRTAAQDCVSPENAFRVLTELSVPAFALFVRVQLEVGLLLKDHVTDVFNFFAQHFYTKHTLFISSPSFMKRSTDAEFSTVLSLYDMLEKMLLWLDEKFSVKNFQR